MALKLIYLFLVSFCLSTQLLYSQNIQTQNSLNFEFQGVIVDSSTNEPLVGATIVIKNTKTGTVTNGNGQFILNLKPAVYTFSCNYFGYQSKLVTIDLTKSITINIPLNPNVTTLNEVKIVSQRKFFGNMEYGREITTINADLIQKQNANNASDILHARLSGVWATKTSGAPGDHEKIRIRGQNSFFSSAEPLYVVDGVPVPIVNMSSLGIADLNMYDIENVTVLKDASATALYGFQGGNGVVLVDTKKGGENEINFSVKLGYQWFDKFYDLFSTDDQLKSFDLASANHVSNIRGFYPLSSDSLCNKDWQKEIFESGNSSDYHLSLSGTSGKTKYYFSGGYNNQKGILPKSRYERYNVATKLSRLFFNKLALEISYRGSIQLNSNNQDIYKGNRLIIEGITKSPCLECIPDSLLVNPYGEYNKRIYYDYAQLYYPELPQTIIATNDHSLDIKTNAINLSARYQINEHLSLNSMGSFMYRHSNYDLRYKNNYYYSYGTILNDIILKSREDVILINHQYNLSYFNTINDHEFGVVLAYRYYEDNLWWNVDTVTGSLNNYSYLRNSMAAYGVDGSVLRKMNSYVGNLSYNYQKKYFISAVANLSHIKEGLYIDYFALFPSLAVSWDLAQENFLKNIKAIDNLNLFINWGKSGNYPLNGLANDLYQDVNYSYGNPVTTTYPAVLQFANHNLRHENTIETDFGTTIGLFGKRLELNALYFKKVISDLVIQRDIPSYYGGGKQYTNVGEIKVTGAEFGINAVPVKKSDFSWVLSFNFSTSRQVVNKLLNNNPMVFSDYDMLSPKFIIEEGSELGSFYGYKCLGKWTQSDENNKLFVNVGGMKFLNADSTNNKLDANDMVVIGNSVPDFTWNFTNSFSYKSFSVDMQWYAVFGVEKFNATRAATYMTGTNREINSYISDTLKAITKKEFYQSSEFVDDASFIRLKTLSINYSPSKDFFGHAKLRFTLSFDNLITITKYKGYDPEATIYTDNNFSDNAIDKGAVPNPKAVYITAGITF